MTIPGQDNQIVAADGQGNAKANSGLLFSKMGSVADFSNASILEAKTSAMKIELTETNSTEDYWENPHGGSLTMTQNPLIQFLGDSELGSPVFSMRGKGIIDIDGGISYHKNGMRAEKIYGTKPYTPWLSEQAQEYYSKVTSPFDPEKKLGNDDLVYPYFMMKESATALFEGSSLLHICGGSSLFMDGNADVRITGSYANDGVVCPQGRTFVSVDPGCTFIMSPLYYDETEKVMKASEYTPVVEITSGANDTLGQIIISAQGEWHDAERRGSWGNYEHWPIYNPMINNGINHLAQFWSGESFLNEDRKYRFAHTKLTTSKPLLRYLETMLAGVKQPSVMLQGKTNIIIGDEGTIGARIGCYGSDSRIGIDWTTQGNTGIRLGSDSGAISIYEVLPAADTITHFRFGPAESCRTAIAIEPHGIFSYKVNPTQVCGIAFAPRCTDIICQWEGFEGIFEGNQVFAQVEGNSHFEFLDDSTVIMRGPTTIGWNAKILTSSSEEDAIRITTSTNCDGFTYEEFWKTLTEKEQEEVTEFLIPNFSCKGRVVVNGTVTATEHYPDRYYIIVEGATVPKFPETSYNFFFVKSDAWSWDAATVMNWQEFKDEVKKVYGENAVASDVTVKDIQQRAFGYWHYIRAQITNARSSCNSETEYAIGTSYENLTEEEKTQIKNKKATWDFSSATVISNDVRSDMTYDNVCQNYTYKTGTHLGQDWVDPINAKTGPVTQMYGLANFCMRGNVQIKNGNDDPVPSQQVVSFTIIPIETYDFSKSQSELIKDLISGEDYSTLKAEIRSYLSTNSIYHFDHIYSISQNEDKIDVTVIFEYKKIDRAENFAPFVEIIGNSEIRIANGVSITTDNINGESAIKIEAPEGKVSFTLAELKALKDLIINPPAPPTVSTIAANTEMEVGTISTEGETGNAQEVEE